MASSPWAGAIFHQRATETPSYQSQRARQMLYAIPDVRVRIRELCLP